MAQPAEATWQDDLLIACEATAWLGDRQIGIIQTRDGRVVNAAHIPVSTQTPGTRRQRGEYAGRLLIAENGDLIDALARLDEFRGAWLIDISELSALIAPGQAIGDEDSTLSTDVDHSEIESLPPAAFSLYATFQRLYRLALSIEFSTLELIVRLGSQTDWHLHPFFVEVARQARGQELDVASVMGGLNVANLPAVTEPVPEPLQAAPRQDPIDLETARSALTNGGMLAGTLRTLRVASVPDRDARGSDASHERWRSCARRSWNWHWQVIRLPCAVGAVRGTEQSPRGHLHEYDQSSGSAVSEGSPASAGSTESQCPRGGDQGSIQLLMPATLVAIAQQRTPYGSRADAAHQDASLAAPYADGRSR